MGIGLVLFIVSLVLIFWNEGECACVFVCFHVHNYIDIGGVVLTSLVLRRHPSLGYRTLKEGNRGSPL